MPYKKRIMMIAGEASGDFHGANVIRAIHKKDPMIEFFGIGGKFMKDQGVRIYMNSSRLAVVGITEVFSKIPDLIKGINTAKRMLQKLQPDLLILIDFPDFNLLVASMAKQLKIPVLYYISPQVWAWRLGRIKKIRRLVDHMAVILPFERSFYQKHGVSVSFVGHPLMDKIKPVLSRTTMKTPASDIKFPVIGLLPGSRDREIHRHLPDMLLAAQRLKQQFPEAGFCVSLAPGIDPDLVNEILSQNRNHLDVKTVSGGADRTFRQSDLVIAASGTVSLEAAISGVPMVIVYKVSPISFKLGKALVKVNFVCLVNLIAGKPLVPELLQDDANPKMIADAAARILNDPDGISRLKADFKRLRQRLGGPGASQRVADIALRIL